MTGTVHVASRNQNSRGPRHFWRLIRSARATKGWPGWGLAGLVMGLIILSIAGVTNEWKISALFVIFLRKLAKGTPLPTSLLWLASLTVVFGFYRLAQARFTALEIMPIQGER
jgi:hypothetical protein